MLQYHFKKLHRLSVVEITRCNHFKLYYCIIDYLSTFFFILKRGSYTNLFEIPSEQPSFWELVNIWESLVDAKSVYFSSCYNMSHSWAHHMSYENCTFWWFWSMFYCFQPCQCMNKHLLVQIHNTYLTIKSL